MKRIGLTGSIGSGKSTVAQLLREKGIPVLDADAVALEVSSSVAVLNAVKETFGVDFVLEHGLNRAKLATLVFANPEARAQLNAIIHPRVRDQMNRLQLELEQTGVAAVVQDIPLLFESKLEHLFDAVILVDAPLETRLKRVLARDGMTREAFLARDAAQMPASEKRLRATVTLENDGSEKELGKQLEQALVTLEIDKKQQDDQLS
jgi:dephospho-CoA kinase